MIPAPVFRPKEEKKYEDGTFCSSDSSSAATLVYNKLTMSSADSNNGIKDVNRRLSANQAKSRESLRLHQFNKIDEVDESMSEADSHERTIQASAVANYTKSNCRETSKVSSKTNELRINNDISHPQFAFNDENMKTKKNGEEFYLKQQKEPSEPTQGYHSKEVENGYIEEVNGIKKVKYEKERDSFKPKAPRNISRHRRISAPDSNYPTITRYTNNIIEDYDITEKRPVDSMAFTEKDQQKDPTSARNYSYAKYSDKYSLTKNCKYFKQLQTNKQQVKELEAEMKVENMDSLEERFEDIRKMKGHRRVASQNYNCANVISKRLSSNKESIEDDIRHKSSKSTEKRDVYQNYMSNQHPIKSTEYYRQRSHTSRLFSKRGSCYNSRENSEDREGSLSKLSPSLNDAIAHDREKLVRFIKLYVKQHNKVPPTTLEFYKIVKLIGKGAFGKVTLGIHKLSGKRVAIKTIEKSYMKDEFSRRKVFQEVYILKKIRHSNIIRLYEVFESSNHLLMVMEYAGKGDLLQHVKNKGRLKEKEARYFFKQILYGLGHCHCRSVLHRDVKLDNILLDAEKGVKICDFGVSKIIKKNQKIVEQ